jgi:plasmid stabilization system protein ParE
MERYSVSIPKPVENDIDDIYNYIAAELMNPRAALDIANGLYDAIDTLSEMPQRFPVVPDERLSLIGYRKLIIDSYIAFYTIDEDNRVVNVERVLYARRDWLNLL